MFDDFVDDVAGRIHKGNLNFNKNGKGLGRKKVEKV